MYMISVNNSIIYTYMLSINDNNDDNNKIIIWTTLRNIIQIIVQWVCRYASELKHKLVDTTFN